MRKLNKREFLMSIAAGAAAMVLATGLLAAGSGSDEKAPAQAKAASGKPVEYLFVQTAHAVTSKGNNLTLHGVAPTTLFFSDRPERITGHGATEGWVKTWSKGDDSFATDPPNATLSILDAAEGVDDVVVELRNPKLVGSSLTYTVKVLDGKLPASGGASALFIDVIGRPLTPMSMAGVGRRTTRRVVRRTVW